MDHGKNYGKGIMADIAFIKAAEEAVDKTISSMWQSLAEDLPELINHDPEVYRNFGDYSIGAPMGNEIGKICISHVSGEAGDFSLSEFFKHIVINEKQLDEFYKKFF